jgi:hypothetical protein
MGDQGRKCQMTRAESKQIEEKIEEGLRLIGLPTAPQLLVPDLPALESPPRSDIVYRMVIGNTTDQ